MTHTTDCPSWCDGATEDAASLVTEEALDHSEHVHSTQRVLYAGDVDEFVVQLHAHREDKPGPDVTITVDDDLDLTPSQARSLAAVLVRLADLAEQAT
jgi:hypothetical protein